MAAAPITKKLMLDSQSVNGKCYVRLLSMLPTFDKANAKDLEHALVYMTQLLGSNPVGSHILPELFITNQMLAGDVEFAQRANFYSLNAINSLRFMEDLFNSRIRYTWEEIGGVQHIANYFDPGVGVTSPEVFTEHGYSARFVLCMLINPGVRVGAGDFDSHLFDDILGGDEDEDVKKPMEDSRFYDSGLASENDELRGKMNDRLREIEALNVQMRKMQKQIAKTSMHQRSPDLDDVTIRRFSDLLSKQTEVEQKSPKENVFPEDSSSNIGRYENRYLEEGTIFDVRGNGKTHLSTQRMVNALRPDKDVVVGFKKTDEMMIRENKVYKRVNSINGLANPFHSHRLNFLCHFDTAIRSIQIRKDNHTHYDVILWIAKNKSQSPSQELLYQVVINTFDLKDNLIIANPYKLPFLEIGMMLSDDCLVKCFDLIRLEFKSLWFDKMKSLIVPEFHDEFIKHKDYKLTTGKSDDHSKQVSFSDSRSRVKSRPPSSSRRRTGSILSFIAENS